MLQDPAPEVRIEVIQALSLFEHPQMLDFVRNVAKQDPSRPVRARALEIAREMAARRQTKLPDEDVLKQAALAAKSGAGEPKLNALLVATRNQGGSDFHLSVAQPPFPGDPPVQHRLLHRGTVERFLKEREAIQGESAELQWRCFPIESTYQARNVLGH